MHKWILTGAAIISTIIIVLKYHLDKKEFIIKHDDFKSWSYLTDLKQSRVFLVSLLIVLGITYMLSMYINKELIIVTKDSRMETIVLLIPIDDTNDGDAYDDGERQALGLINLLSKMNKDLQKYHIKVYNHGMNEDEAKRIIIEELKSGTQYFVSTMSKISVPVSKHFDTWVNDYSPKGKDPKIILTVSSAPDIEVKKDRVYRFYIRSEDEGLVLANAANNLTNIRSAIFLAVKDSYGEGAVKTFKEQWESLGNQFEEGMYLEVLSNESDVLESISNNIHKFQPFKDKLIFIAHYGGGIDKIITSLNNLNLFPTIVATSTLSIESWRKPIEDVLGNFSWITCVPKYKDRGNSIYEGDVVQDFVYYSLDRLIKVINDCESTGKTFHKVWMENHEPQRLDFELKDTGDTKFTLIYDEHIK